MGVNGALLGVSPAYEKSQCGESAVLSCDSLARRRDAIAHQWRRFRNGLPISEQYVIDRDILSSWQRSEAHIQTFQLHAPGDDVVSAEKCWLESPIRLAAQPSLNSIMQMADEGDLVAAIADPNGRLIWTYAGKHIRERAKSINLSVGSDWHEHRMGTNAIGVALTQNSPSTVFSAEHFQPFAHDWVSYAAPVCYPQSEECAGVLSLFSTWKRHTPLGEAAVAGLARSVMLELPDERPKADLEIYALGQPRVVLHGRQLRLPFRQIEILCLLALNTRGLSLEAFHAALYGDSRVSLSTLKAELSHLRRLLDGKIGSRPYRLQISVWGDFIEIWKTLRRKNSGQAFSLYRGPLLPESESPELEEWRHCIDAVMSQALGNCQDPVVLMDKLCRSTSGSELVRERLYEIMSPLG
jgi:hypothetical protein